VLSPIRPRPAGDPPLTRSCKDPPSLPTLPEQRSDAGCPSRPAAADVVCVGETMAVLSPPDSRPLAEQPSLALSVGGAESNVACGLAALGHRAAWLSRVGDDPFGRRVLAEVAARGVDVSAVEVDPDRQTGVYFKDPGPDATGTHYYRRDSAASRMGPELARHPLLGAARVVHLSGITAALSDSCAALLEQLVTARAAAGVAVSFDVNYRPALWRREPAAAARRLLSLARGADIVFVGRDEAETLWGTAEAWQIRDLLKPVPLIVVKDGGHGATSYAADWAQTFVPAPRCRIVERVGAGDAFAAGFLAALLEGHGAAGRLRLGHLVATATLLSRADAPVVPPRAELERMLGLDDAAWSALCHP
jgi:2-dehydro-3-deoxygluconokinase